MRASRPNTPGHSPANPEIGQPWPKSGRSQASSVTLVGYGPNTAAAQLTAVADRLPAHITVTGVFLVTGGRYVCLACPCPAAGDGMPFDPATTATAARSTVAGL